MQRSVAMIDPITSAALAGAGRQIADMTLEGAGARDLTYLDLRVYGNGGGDFDVTVELWTDCTGNGGTPIPGITNKRCFGEARSRVYIIRLEDEAGQPPLPVMNSGIRTPEPKRESHSDAP